MAQANQILVSLKDDPEFWLNADMILEKSQSNNTKFFALQVLEEAVKVNLTFSHE
jgi:exportin-1